MEVLFGNSKIQYVSWVFSYQLKLRRIKIILTQYITIIGIFTHSVYNLFKMKKNYLINENILILQKILIGFSLAIITPFDMKSKLMMVLVEYSFVNFILDMLRFSFTHYPVTG